LGGDWAATEAYIERMNRHDPQDQMIEDVKASQQNLVWPDAMVNSGSVDELLWRGSPKATKVQRIGIAIWGMGFACVGIALVSLAYEKHNLIPALLGLLSLALGARLFRNAFKRCVNVARAKKH
jgi:hypothetical protein